MIHRARHCQLAELAAIIGMCGDVCISAAERFRLRIHTENAAVSRKCFTLLRKTFSIRSDVSVHLNKKYGKSCRIYTILVRDHSSVVRILQALKLLDANGEIAEQVSPANQLLVQKSCCRRALSEGRFWPQVQSAIQRNPIISRLSASQWSGPRSFSS